MKPVRALAYLLPLAALLTAAYYFLVLRENFHVVIDDELYRSAQLGGSRLEEIIAKNGIRSVINLRGARPGSRWYREEKQAVRNSGIVHHDIRFSARGLPPLAKALQLQRLLESAPRPLLVHCQGGADRSGMASVMAMLLDETRSLEEIRQQVSARYLVYHDDSIGKMFLGQYTRWLSDTGRRHSPRVYRHWLNTEYVDGTGNLLFYIDQINREMWKSGTRYEDGYRYQMAPGSTPELEISGWAVDIRRQGQVAGVDIYLGDRRLGSADYGFAYAGVAQYLRNDAYMDSGWMFRARLAGSPPGCHDLRLAIRKKGGAQWMSAPQAMVCIPQ